MKFEVDEQTQTYDFIDTEMCYPWGVKQETSHVFSISPVFNLLLPPLNLTHERGTELVTDLGMQKATES